MKTERKGKLSEIFYRLTVHFVIHIDTDTDQNTDSKNRHRRTAVTHSQTDTTNLNRALSSRCDKVDKVIINKKYEYLNVKKKETLKKYI